jgi:hypothetical protein
MQARSRVRLAAAFVGFVLVVAALVATMDRWLPLVAPPP